MYNFEGYHFITGLVFKSDLVYLFLKQDQYH